MKKLERFIVRNIAGETVMMPVGKTAVKFNGLITANEVAAYIWNHVEEVDSAEALTELICQEFEVDYEIALTDTQEIVRDMIAAGWIAE